MRFPDWWVSVRFRCKCKSKLQCNRGRVPQNESSRHTDGEPVKSDRDDANTPANNTCNNDCDGSGNDGYDANITANNNFTVSICDNLANATTILA